MNRKTICLKIIFSFLLITTYLLIFIFSSEDAVKSTKTSKGTTYEIVSMFNGSNEVSQDTIDKYDSVLRKIAHFSIYTLSGVWSMCLVITSFGSSNSVKEKSKSFIKDLDLQMLIISVLIGFLYACTDEIHQIFVLGRSGQLVDILIDSMGVLNGSLLALLIRKIFKP